MRKIAVFTGTRAEYGLLYWLLRDIQDDSELKLQLIVSGTHLSPEFGNTHRQIEEDGFILDEKIEILLSSDSPVGIAKSMGLGLLGFSDALARLKPDVLVVLGDRYEALAVAQTAMVMHIPILHLHGGEITEGAYDDAIRHAITKLSLFHCTATEEYRNRVIQLGESPERVKNVGAIGLDHLKRTKLLSLRQLSESLSFELSKPFFLVTYHPVTLSSEEAAPTFRMLLDALEDYPGYQVIITYPNADEGGRQIIPLLETFAAGQPKRVLAIPSMGQLRYLSALLYATAVIGNSSSGIIEAPSFGVPTVNIGDRQKGRMAASSVTHCEINTDAIRKAIQCAISGDYSKDKAGKVRNPYGEGDASKQIVSILKAMDLDCVKTFHDLESNTGVAT